MVEGKKFSLKRHFPIIYSHERRNYGAVKAFMISILRSLSFYSTICEEIRWGEFIVDDCVDPVGIFHVVAKGHTIRGMWFYQKSSYSRCYLYFYSILVSVKYAFDL